MAKPGVISTQFVAEPALPSAANATGARRQIARATSRIVTHLFMELLLVYEMAARRWLPDILVQPGSHWAADQAGLVLLGHRPAHVDDWQQRKHKRLQDANEDVQGDEERRPDQWHYRQDV